MSVKKEESEVGLDIIPPCPTGLFLEIAPGDTLFGIAREQGTSVEAILALNPHLDPRKLQVGAIICLPLPGGQV